MIDTALVERLDAALPQTQCTRCGYPRCRRYAEAIARGEADINRCPPGGEPTLSALAELLETARKPLDPACGLHEPRRRAAIDESVCIGCRKCIDACPVDAIVGTNKWMHTVIAAQCSGCGLCLPPCPVDCISLVPVAVDAHDGMWAEYPDPEVRQGRPRTEARLARLARGHARAPRRAAAHAASVAEAPSRERIRAEIEAAIERVKRKREAAGR